MVEEGIGGGQGTWLARFSIVKISRYLQGFDPKYWWKSGMKKEGADSFVQGAQNTFGLPILLGGVRT